MVYFSPLSLQSLLIAIVRFRAWQGTNVAQENDAANGSPVARGNVVAEERGVDQCGDDWFGDTTINRG